MSHAEAERLISARLDAPLDPAQNRTLLAHLATCDSCRAFAASMEAMSTDLRSLPVLPASPVVSRQVRARISQQPSPWSRFAEIFFNGRWGAIPAAAAGVAVVAIVAIALMLHGSDPDRGAAPLAAPNTTTLAMASATNEASVAGTTGGGDPTGTATVVKMPKFANVQVTQTPTPTATAQPTETATAFPTQTATAEPIATSTPQPTETANSAPVVIETDTPEATATDEPPAESPTSPPANTPPPTETATTQPIDTATTEPTETATTEPTETATSEPAATDTVQPTETATIEPTATETAQPTETSTPKPTKTPKPPKPTKTPTTSPIDAGAPATPVENPTERPQKPTRTPTTEPQGAPTIAPKGGQSSQAIDPSAAGASTTDQVDPSSVETAPTDGGESQIVPVGGQTQDATVTPGAVSTDAPAIEAVGPTDTPKPAKGDSKSKAKGADTGPIAQSQTLAQLPAPIEPGSVIRMNPDGGAFVVSDSSGCTVYDLNGNAVAAISGANRPVWTPYGTAMLVSAPGDSGMTATIWLSQSQSSFAIAAPSDRPFADYPAGADGDAFYFVREFSDKQGGIEVHRTLFSDNSDSAIWSGGDSLSGDPIVTNAGVVFASGGSFWSVSPDGDASQSGDNPYGDIVAPLRSPGGDGFVFAAGDNLIVTSSDSPGAGSSVPYDPGANGGYAFSPDGSEIAVASGDTLAVETAGGSQEGVTSSADGAPLMVVGWTSDGILVVDNGDQPVLQLVSPDIVKAGNS